MWTIISYLAPTMILTRRLIRYYFFVYFSNQDSCNQSIPESREDIARRLRLKLRIMKFRRLGYRRMSIMMKRDYCKQNTRQIKNYRWRELNKELLRLRIKIDYARSEERFSSRVEKFCSTTDFLGLYRMQNMFKRVTNNKYLSDLQSTVRNARSSLVSLGFYINTDHCVQRNVHTDCIFLTEKDSDMPIVIDTGASVSLTPNRSDFISFEERESSVHGIGAVSKVQGVGTVRWKIYDADNQKHTIETRALYMPAAGIRLYSPQTHFQENTDGTMHITHDKVRLRFPNTTAPLNFPFQHGNNLPLMLPVSQQANASYHPFKLSHHIAS